MKKLFIITAVAGILALTAHQSNAQVNVQVNIGAQPTWVPSNYQSVHYYYLPDVHTYYDVPRREFVYLNGNSWTRSKYLPGRYRSYNLSHGRKVIVHGANPFNNYNVHRVQYANHVRVINHYERVPSRYYNAPRNYHGHGKQEHFNNGHRKGRH